MPASGAISLVSPAATLIMRPHIESTNYFGLHRNISIYRDYKNFVDTPLKLRVTLPTFAYLSRPEATTSVIERRF